MPTYYSFITVPCSLQDRHSCVRTTKAPPWSAEFTLLFPGTVYILFKRPLRQAGLKNHECIRGVCFAAVVYPRMPVGLSIQYGMVIVPLPLDFARSLLARLSPQMPVGMRRASIHVHSCAAFGPVSLSPPFPSPSCAHVTSEGWIAESFDPGEGRRLLAIMDVSVSLVTYRGT